MSAMELQEGEEHSKNKEKINKSYVFMVLNTQLASPDLKINRLDISLVHFLHFYGL